jgi:hypothetical protein
VQDFGDWQDDHVEKDLGESQRGSGQDVLLAVVRFNRCFWDDSRNYTEKKKHQFVLSQLTGM